MTTQTLKQLEQTLKNNGKFWMYQSRVLDNMSDEQKKHIAEQVLVAPKSWAQGMLDDFNSREYPATYEGN